MKDKIDKNMRKVKCPFCKGPLLAVVRPGGWWFFDCAHCGRAGKINVKTNKVVESFYMPGVPL